MEFVYVWKKYRHVYFSNMFIVENVIHVYCVQHFTLKIHLRKMFILLIVYPNAFIKSVGTNTHNNDIQFVSWCLKISSNIIHLSSCSGVE